MPYSPREAVTVALYNAKIQPLHDAFELADEVIRGLTSMGFEVVDKHHTRDLDTARLETAQFLSKAALKAVPDLEV